MKGDRAMTDTALIEWYFGPCNVNREDGRQLWTVKRMSGACGLPPTFYLYRLDQFRASRPSWGEAINACYCIDKRDEKLGTIGGW